MVLVFYCMSCLSGVILLVLKIDGDDIRRISVIRIEVKIIIDFLQCIKRDSKEIHLKCGMCFVCGLNNQLRSPE